MRGENQGGASPWLNADARPMQRARRHVEHRPIVERACIFPRYELCADCVTAKPLLRRLELHGPCITRGLLFTRNPSSSPPPLLV